MSVDAGDQANDGDLTDAYQRSMERQELPLRLPQHLVRQLQLMAAASELSVNELVITLLEQFFGDSTH